MYLFKKYFVAKHHSFKGKKVPLNLEVLFDRIVLLSNQLPFPECQVKILLGSVPCNYIMCTICN